MIYKTLALTGLRKGELASLTVGQLDLDADPPFLMLDAADEKNRQGSTLPLRGDLAADLGEWLLTRRRPYRRPPDAPTWRLTRKTGTENATGDSRG